ncbi:SH3 and PX domain-containing protein 2B isoform 4-T4 [Anableps anableps]
MLFFFSFLLHSFSFSSGFVERATTFLKRGDPTNADALFLEQYVAVTDYEKQESTEISLHVGQIVEVIEKNESGWWFVSSEDAQGWVPATCLEAQDDPDDFTIPGEEEEKYSVIYPYSARDQDEIDLERGMIVEVIQKNLEGWWKIRYQGREGWAPASYLKKSDIQRQSAGAAAHASTNDLEGVSKQNLQNNASRDNQKENRLSIFSDNNKIKVGSRHGLPPRRDLTIPRGTNLPKPPVPPQVEEEYYTIADFQTTIPDGISFQAGVKVEVVEKNGSGWWYIQIDDKEGWAPATFIDKYKKTSNALRPNFLAPLPNEMEKLRLEDGGANVSDDTWSKPLPDEPTTASDSFTRPKLRDWKSSASKTTPAFSGPLPPAPAAPPVEEKPALPPRRESINKSFELDAAEKPKPDHCKPLPPKPPAPGVIMPLVTPKSAPFKPEKPPEIKKEDKSKALPLRNEMGLECGHKVSAKEVKKFNLKPVPKQPPKPKADIREEKPEAAGPATFMKGKPVVRPKPIPAAKPDPPAENKVDITNLRSKLRPSKPTDLGSSSSEGNHQNDASAAGSSSPSNSSPIHIPMLNNSKSSDEPKLPPKHINGLSQDRSPPSAKPAVPPHKEPPQRPPAMAPKRPPPPKKTDPSSPTENKSPSLKEPQEVPKPGPPLQLSRPPPPKPKTFVQPPSSKEKDDPKGNKAPIPPKPQMKHEKPGPPKDKLPPLLKEPSRDELYLAVADFEGDEQTSGFKVGTVFEVLEKNSSGWWFCKNVGEDVEGWIPSNYLSKKP